MFTLDGAPGIERFELVSVSLRSPTGSIRLPIVNQWLELQLGIRCVPDEEDRRAFFALLRRLIEELRELRPGLSWYFLHKPPGLKLRFGVGGPDVALLDRLLSAVLAWDLPWLAGVAAGSVFDQAELLSALYRDDVGRLLTRAADCHLAAAVAGRYCSEEEWAAFLVALLSSLGLDSWLVYEVLARIGRLRATDLSARAPSAAEPLLDPSGLLNGPLPEFSSGFETSLSLLQGLNLMFNLWAVDAAPQARILAAGCAITRPPIMVAKDD